MKLKELTIEEFTNFVATNPLKNYMQTEEYARLMGEYRFNYDYIGLINEQNNIVATSLILTKKIGINLKYGYAPKGFLINYYDEDLLKTFITLLKEYYSKKNVVFIKVNPEIVVAEINPKTKEITPNSNITLKRKFESYGFTKLKDNLYFEALNPRFNVYVDLKKSDYKNYSKTNRNKVNNSKRKGLYLTKGSIEDLEEIYPFFNTPRKLKHYKNMIDFNQKKDSLDIILIKVDFEKFIKNSQALYDKELDKNNLYNEILHRSHKSSDLNKKMASDSKLCVIKNEIVNATEGLRDYKNVIVAAALVVKHGNRVHIIESGFNKKFAYLNANYFLYDSLINYYKKDYDYLDLNGITGNFKKDNPYNGLNKFKLGFNPKIYEYIGEYDLVFNRINYDYLLSTGKLADEFNK